MQKVPHRRPLRVENRTGRGAHLLEQRLGVGFDVAVLQDALHDEATPEGRNRLGRGGAHLLEQRLGVGSDVAVLQDALHDEATPGGNTKTREGRAPPRAAPWCRRGCRSARGCAARRGSRRGGAPWSRTRRAARPCSAAAPCAARGARAARAHAPPAPAMSPPQTMLNSQSQPRKWPHARQLLPHVHQQHCMQKYSTTDLKTNPLKKLEMCYLEQL